MKKILVTLSTTALLAVGGNAQGLVAGWDFSSNPGSSSAVSDYAAEFTSVNNGNATSGTLKTSSFTQRPTAGAQVGFSNSGAAADGDAAGAGFDTSSDKELGAATGSGQQSLSFFNLSANFTFDIEFTATEDAIMDFDYAMDSPDYGAGSFDDFLDVSYYDGTNWVAYQPNGGGNFGGPDYELYDATVGTWGSTKSAGTLHGNTDFLGTPAQSNGTIDLTGFGAVSGIRLTVDIGDATTSDVIAFDNIIVTGTAVPEPSAYAAIAGALALALVSVRRRGK